MTGKFIRLIEDLPIDPQHGMTAGRVLPVVESKPGPTGMRSVRWIVLSPETGIRIAVFGREAVEVAGPQEPQEPQP